MRHHLRMLHYLRWALLAIVLIVWGVSQIGFLRVSQLGGPQNDGVMFGSAKGIFFFNRRSSVDAPMPRGVWESELYFFSEPVFRNASFPFPWLTLGFRFWSERFEAQQYRVGADDRTLYTRPRFDQLHVSIPYWSMALLLGWPELVWLVRRGKARLMRDVEQAAAAPSILDDSIIARDLACVHCGYNLRMQPRNGRCSECGSPVIDTLNLNAELARSRPGWLKWLAAGNLLLFTCRCALLVLYAELFEREFRYMLPTALIAAVVYAAGMFCLTLPEHPYLESLDRGRARWQRIMAAVMLVLIVMAMWFQYQVPQIPGILGVFDAIGSRGVFRSITLELGLLAWLIFSALIAMEYHFLARLAGRLLDRFMTEHCRIAGIGAAVGGVIVLAVVRVIARNAIPWNPVWLWALIAVVVLWQLFVIWAAFMNGYCAVRFLQQAWIAERNWERSREQDAGPAARPPDELVGRA